MLADDLYNARIMELARNRSADGRLDRPSASATVNNPLCGDRVTIDVAMNGAVLAALGHKVRGCALCRASAALLGAHAPGKDAAHLSGIAGIVEAMLKRNGPAPAGEWNAIGIFRPVVGHKSRHDCVLLPFQALIEALDQVPVRR